MIFLLLGLPKLLVNCFLNIFSCASFICSSVYPFSLKVFVICVLILDFLVLIGLVVVLFGVSIVASIMFFLGLPLIFLGGS